MRRGVGGHAAALAGLWLFFLELHVAVLPGEVDQEWKAGRGGARTEQAAAPPARVPWALWQQWQDVGIRCSYLATERAFPPGINAGVRPSLAEN